MFRKLAAIFFLSPFFFPGHAGAQEFSLQFTDNDRVLVIAPHPDDETLGLGGVIQSAKAANAKIKIVYLTNGEANEVSSLFYKKRPLLLRSDFLKSGLARKNEAVEAMGHLGLDPADLIFFGYPDGGMLNIWLKHWGHSKPFRSFMTRINKVPYQDEFSYGHPYKGDEIVHDLEKVLLSFEPTQLFVTAPFDLNADHQAAYLYLQVALLDLDEQLKPAPQLHLYLIHAHQWPAQKKYLPREPLPIPDHIDWQGQLRWHVYALDPKRVEKKAETLLKYKSQIAYKKDFLLSFARSNELFCEYPPEKLIPEIVEIGRPSTFEATAESGDVVYRLIGRELWLEVPLTNALDEMGVLNTYVFAYRKGFLFSEMPKLVFKLFGSKMFVYDGARSVFDPAIVYKRDKERLWIRIPLARLKDPDHFFVSTRNAKEEMTLDFGSWKLLELL